MVLEEAIKRRLEFGELTGVALSPRQDDFVVLQAGDHDTPLETVLKTEFLTTLADKVLAKTGRALPVRPRGPRAGRAPRLTRPLHRAA